MHRSILIVGAALIATAAYAQPTTSIEAMAALQPLVGKWEGEGWIVRQGVGRERFVGEETVTPRLSGAAILVEGRHRSAAEPTRVIHDALAMIVWSPRDKVYRFRSQLATGQSGEYALTVEPGKFIWILTTPDGGKVEYTTLFDASTWHETGRFSRDGANWTPIFEMKLKKKN
jgi:hypothetical protein